jgi:hypothetical protein
MIPQTAIVSLLKNEYYKNVKRRFRQVRVLTLSLESHPLGHITKEVLLKDKLSAFELLVITGSIQPFK